MKITKPAREGRRPSSRLRIVYLSHCLESFFLTPVMPSSVRVHTPVMLDAFYEALVTLTCDVWFPLFLLAETFFT